jgi:hypothetical protein
MEVVMNHKLIALFCVFLFGAVLVSADGDLEYTNVNVVLETEWMEPEEVNNVDVVVLALSDGSKQIVLFRKYEKIMEITVIDGVKVKIFDADNGKLLKTFSKEPISALE